MQNIYITGTGFWIPEDGLTNDIQQEPGLQLFFSGNKKLLSTLSLVWGVSTFYYNKKISTDHTIADIKHLLKEGKRVESGDLIINTASIPLGESGKTNMLKLSYID